MTNNKDKTIEEIKGTMFVNYFMRNKMGFSDEDEVIGIGTVEETLECFRDYVMTLVNQNYTPNTEVQKKVSEDSIRNFIEWHKEETRKNKEKILESWDDDIKNYLKTQTTKEQQ